MKTAKNMVFVYGTLRRGHGNHRVMQRAGGEFVCVATTAHPHILRRDGIPKLIYGSKGQGSEVEGEVFCLPKPSAFKDLDRLEGHPNLYRRAPIEVKDGAGNVVKVWCYYWVLP